MTRLCALPLDSRPCSALFPLDFARWCGCELTMPRPDEMDHFTTPASLGMSRAFIERAAPGSAALCLSVDHWCYGSLLGSRTMDVSQSEALQRLDTLRAVKARWPQLKIYAFSVIVRASISALASGDLDAYRAMGDYSYHSGRAEALGSEEDRRLAEQAKARIPAPILTRYHAVRARNHAVNRAAIALTQEGVFDALSLLMEDAPHYGFHRAEQAALKELIRPGDPIRLRNGADEGTAVAVMKVILGGRRPRADVVWLGDQRFTARYEDRPFRENVADVLADLGIDVTPGADAVIAIAAPPDGDQREAADIPPDGAIDLQARAVDALIEGGRRVYLLDVVGANGGCLQLMRAIARPDALWGYSAWNTASNALGTLCAQLCSDWLRGEPNKRHRDARFLDDCLYQTLLRPRLNQALAARGEDVFSLRDKAAAEEALRDLFDHCGEPLAELGQPMRASLPWPRTFEARIECD